MNQAWFSPSARHDVHELFNYVARDKPIAAAEFVDRPESTCAQLARFPEMGSLRDDLAAGLRVFAVGSHLILYRPTAEGVDIVRIVHGARDVSSLFQKALGTLVPATGRVA